MSRSFAEWVTESRMKALLCVFAAAWVGLMVPFLPWAPGALIVLLSLVETPVTAGTAAAIALSVLIGLVAPAMGPWPALLLAAALVLPQWAIGRMLARGATLSACFQFTTLAVLAMLVAVYVVLNDPAGVWKPLLTQFSQALDRFASMMSNTVTGRRVDEQELVDASAAHAWGAVGWLLLLNTTVSALVGQYWSRGKQPARGAGSSFGGLAAGRTLSIVFVACALGAMLFTSAFCTDALMVFGGVFVLQGLAILHTGLLAYGLGGVSLGLGYAGGFLAFLLLSLVLPALALAVQGGLFLSGFVDNWIALRPRIVAARAGRTP